MNQMNQLNQPSRLNQWKAISSMGVVVWST